MPKKRARKVRLEIDCDLAARVMFASDRTCCVCRNLGRKTQIHHIDEDPGNNDIENLAVICFDCHSDGHSNIAFARNLTSELIRLYNDNWRQIVGQKRGLAEPDATEVELRGQILLGMSMSLTRFFRQCIHALPARTETALAAYVFHEVGSVRWEEISKISYEFSEELWSTWLALAGPSFVAAIEELERYLLLHGNYIRPQVRLAILKSRSDMASHVLVARLHYGAGPSRANRDQLITRTIHQLANTIREIELAIEKSQIVLGEDY